MECSVDYAVSSHQYAEMLTICQPFYALSPATSFQKSSLPLQQPIYIHPRLEDGLQKQSQHQQFTSRFENPQDPSANRQNEATVIDFPANSTVSRPVSCSSSGYSQDGSSNPSLDSSNSSLSSYDSDSEAQR
ncbi:hypothetical protein IV203_030781 [Nitzschia inconspicua]|uniref:Uncharacterized protein n=1 Tax=Nitzschia inconspicua TaxID=303405 RepID=A0A9K3Q1Y8_9STRA|nr:hypothetical protein IV203_030781 [Nitzschia inconspicua]